MVKLYAVFSIKHPIYHWMFIATLLLIWIAGASLLLETNQFIYVWGMGLPVLPWFLLAKASSYKRRYL
ncbi:hypothetical protein [uncultured Photobacterium sp.]|uniref:hypothetical protein n=1 Tax=uncultured Photobacterium sp. TaxID=173973 RepID=UPI0026275213|nr:hypothetical protein [uncultured Photobacterium sp.]